MNYSRQVEVFDNKKSGAVHIIGCGATGSWVAHSLARLGVSEIHLYDFDIVEEHNVPNQAFEYSDIGKPKVDALRDALLRVNPKIEVFAFNKKVDGGEPMHGVVFLLVDSMKARKDIFSKSVKFKSNVKRMIETRMDAYIGMVYTVSPLNMDDIQKYEQTLYSDDTATVSMCGVAQSLAPTASILANYAVWQYIKHVMEAEDIANEIMLDLKFTSVIPSSWS